MRTKLCNVCGREIVWARSAETGKPIPLDPHPAVYEVLSDEDSESGALECVLIPRESVMVTHFATCLKANDFSGI